MTMRDPRVEIGNNHESVKYVFLPVYGWLTFLVGESI